MTQRRRDGRGPAVPPRTGSDAGFHNFADELRQASDTVHTLDLFDGRTFANIEDGTAYAEQVGFPTGSSSAGCTPRTS